MKHIIHGALTKFVGRINFKQLLLHCRYEGSVADEF